METNKIDYLTIQQYLNGQLDDKTMHHLEKQALEDPFLADALDGYAQTEVTAARQLSLLQMQLHVRIAQQQENKKALNFSWQRLSIAAAAGLLFLTASILFWIKRDRAEQLATLRSKQVEVTLSPIDSITRISSLKKGLQYSQLEATEPVGGWAKFNAYLKANIRSGLQFVSGQVILSFAVDTAGRPYGVKIVKSLTKANNLEAIRLIKKGPLWQARQNSIVQVTVNFSKK